MSLKTGLLPVARSDARVLILGSLPGDASLAVAQYYAHPRNHFWLLMGTVIHRDLRSASYPDRLDVLQNTGIALWDVIGSAQREGSLDQQIRDIRVNDVHSLCERLPALRAVAFNGKKAEQIGRPIFEKLGLDLHQLPSSSPAYTMSFENKLAKWLALAKYVQL